MIGDPNHLAMLDGISKLTDLHNSLQAQINEIRREMKPNASALSLQLGEIEKALDVLHTGLKAQKQAVDAVNGRMNAHEERLDSHAKEINSIRNALDRYTTTMRERMETRDSILGDHAKQIEALEKRIHTLEQQEIGAQIDEFNDHCRHLTSRMERIEREVTGGVSIADTKQNEGPVHFTRDYVERIEQENKNLKLQIENLVQPHAGLAVINRWLEAGCVIRAVDPLNFRITPAGVHGLNVNFPGGKPLAPHQSQS